MPSATYKRHVERGEGHAFSSDQRAAHVPAVVAPQAWQGFLGQRSIERRATHRDHRGESRVKLLPPKDPRIYPSIRRYIAIFLERVLTQARHGAAEARNPRLVGSPTAFEALSAS